MKKSLLCILLWSLIPSTLVFSQARESADETSNSLQAGAEFSVFNPDFYCSSNSPLTCGGRYSLLKGVGVFGDFNVRPNWGAEGEARWLHWDGLQGQVESTYLIGPRYRIYRFRRVGLWVKFLVGIGGITTQGYPGPNTLKGTMFVYAPGAAVNYRLTRKFAIRGDYEFQKWPSFAVMPPHNHGLTPNGFSVGVVYTIIH